MKLWFHIVQGYLWWIHQYYCEIAHSTSRYITKEGWTLVVNTRCHAHIVPSQRGSTWWHATKNLWTYYKENGAIQYLLNLWIYVDNAQNYKNGDVSGSRSFLNRKNFFLLSSINRNFSEYKKNLLYELCGKNVGKFVLFAIYFIWFTLGMWMLQLYNFVAAFSLKGQHTWLGVCNC